jgi:hypothetical protein
MTRAEAVSEVITRHDFLAELHRAYEPRSYLEIGINKGRSLALSRTRTIAVDPSFKITTEVHCDVQVVRATSDDFFARENPLAHFPNRSIDLGFVDGLHQFEFALRDFMNLERHAEWTSLLLVDDILPRSIPEASRGRETVGAWAGDVFKVAEVLQRYRPDLVTLPLDIEPTGVLLVLGADPTRSTLQDHYEAIVAEYVYPDPQRVPEAVLRRETAIDPASILESGVLTELRNARDSGLTREAVWDDLRRSVEQAARPAARRELTPPKLRHEQANKKRAAASAPPPGAARRALAGVRRRLRPLRRRLRRRGRRSG